MPSNWRPRLGYTAVACRCKHVKRSASPEGNDPLFDQFMPTYEVVERHKVRVAVPAEITRSSAYEMEFQDSLLSEASAVSAIREEY